MTTQHTPGPWGISRYASTYVVANERGICSTGGHSNNMVDQEVLTDENEANARLIAAAPELYEAAIGAGAALAAAISLLEGGGKKAAPSDRMFDQMLLDYNAALDRARAALAKARGEA